MDTDKKALLIVVSVCIVLIIIGIYGNYIRSSNINEILPTIYVEKVPNSDIYIGFTEKELDEWYSNLSQWNKIRLFLQWNLVL